MANFAYIVKDPKGIRREGSLSAPNLDAAVGVLQSEGNIIISLKRIVKESEKVSATLLDKIAENITRIRTYVPLRIRVFFTVQLSTMFSAGLTLEKSISNLLQEERNRRFKSVLAQLDMDIKKGLSLSDALAKHSGVFDELYVATVKSGEISGTLHVVLGQLANYLESTEDTRRKVVSALSYPVFVLCFLSAVLTLMLLKIIPMFDEVYTRFHAELPLLTRMLIGFSHAVRNQFLLTVLCVIMFCIFIGLVYITDKGRLFFDILKLKIPFWGTLIRDAIVVKFARTFSILMGSAVPVLEAVGYLEGVVGNRLFAEALKQAKRAIRDGATISKSLRKTLIFPGVLLQLIATGEETGEISILLNRAADFYEKQVNAVISRITSIIEPLLVVFMGTIVGVVVIVLYLPVFYLGMAIKRGVR